MLKSLTQAIADATQLVRALEAQKLTLSGYVLLPALRVMHLNFSSDAKQQAGFLYQVGIGI